MNNLYHKVAFASVCTALGFVLIPNKEAKAAVFTLTSTNSFFVGDKDQDGLGDYIYGDVPLSVGIKDERHIQNSREDEEYKAFYEFNVANLSLAPNTTISSAIFQPKANTVSWYGSRSRLDAQGYIGNGQADVSDFQAGEYLDGIYFYTVLNTGSEIDLSPIFSFNVLPFVTQRIKDNDTFVGLKVFTRGGYLTFDREANLIITTVDVTEPVPEPTTILSAAIALGWGGWLKRKKSS
jgi:PEP-CTERM putative exosortase interaction domain